MGNKGNTSFVPCIFCDIKQDKTKILLQNQEFFAFHDISKSSAQQHILVCTKTHITNALDPAIRNPQQLYRMRQFGNKVLNKICDQNNIKQRNYRFGFHLPPYNSVHHIHLHCFVEPFSSFLINKFHFGWMLHSVEDVQAKWKSKWGKL